jgi:UDP-glucuronate decarboxylase
VDFLQYDMNAPIGFNVHVDYIIHAAGNAHPAAFNGNPVGTTMGNIESTFRLLEYLRLHEGKRLLYVSSGEVYGQGDVSLDSFDELYSGYLDVLSPRSCYPLSKRMTENLCSSYWK